MVTRCCVTLPAEKRQILISDMCKEKNMMLSIHIAILLFLGGFILSAGALRAQDPTASESISARQNLERDRIEYQINQATAPIPGIKVTSPQLPPPDMDGKSRQKIFKLNKVNFDPMPKSVPQSELEAVAAKYVAMDEVSMYDLYLMIVEIDALFDERHVLGRSGLPVQDVENGIVTVQIIEGRESNRTLTTTAPSYFGIGDTQVPSNRLAGQYFVRRQFHFSDKSSFNVQELEDEMLRFNRVFSGRIIAGIEPGAEQGDFSLNLKREFPRLISGSYSIDNTGRESSGSIRNGFSLTVSDILGVNESFLISYNKTEGTSSLYLQGKIPISTFGTFFDMSYYYGEPKTTSGQFAALVINGTSEQYRPGLRQILINRKDHRLDALINYENYDSKTNFDKALNYAEKHDAWTFGVDYSKPSSALYADFSLITGSAKTLTLPEPDYTKAHFNLLKMSLMKVQPFGGGRLSAILRGNAGVALSDLPPSQFFQIGGMSTVRGTPEALVSGDTGYLSVGELRFHIWPGFKSRPLIPATRLEFFKFFDHGGVFDRKTSRNDFLSSTGSGGTFYIDRYFSVTVLYGKPVLKNKASEIYKESLESGKWSFTLKASF